MSTKIIRAILVALLKCDGQPMPEDALITAVQLTCRPDEPTEGDVVNQMKELVSQKLIEGATDETTKERFWALTTPKGLMKARQLR
jgi:hypothetical protein